MSDFTPSPETLALVDQIKAVLNGLTERERRFVREFLSEPPDSKASVLSLNSLRAERAKANRGRRAA